VAAKEPTTRTRRAKGARMSTGDTTMDVPAPSDAEARQRARDRAGDDAPPRGAGRTRRSSKDG
jgi:hypothetical protein